MRINTEFLQELGFQHQKYPDGWFFVLMPKPGDAAFKLLGETLGYSELDMMEMADDTAILQCDDATANWSYVFGADVGSMDADTVQRVLCQLKTNIEGGKPK